MSGNGETLQPQLNCGRYLISREEIKEALVTIVADVSGSEVNEVAEDKNLYEDLGIDSIKAIEIIVAIEKKFKVSVRDEDVPRITTVRQAVDLTSNLLMQAVSHA